MIDWHFLVPRYFEASEKVKLKCPMDARIVIEESERDWFSQINASPLLLPCIPYISTESQNLVIVGRLQECRKRMMTDVPVYTPHKSIGSQKPHRPCQ